MNVLLWVTSLIGATLLGYTIGTLQYDVACTRGEVQIIEGRAYRCIPVEMPK